MDLLAAVPDAGCLVVARQDVLESKSNYLSVQNGDLSEVLHVGDETDNCEGWFYARIISGGAHGWLRQEANFSIWLARSSTSPTLSMICSSSSAAFR